MHVEEIETEKLVQLIRRRETCITVIGLGRVGLPVAAVYAEAGHHVIGVDVKRALVESVSSETIHMTEPGLELLIKRAVASGKLETTTSLVQAVKKSDIIIVCVQTPLARGRKPNMTYLEKACKNIARALSKGKLVVVESTVPPGTMKNIVAKILEERSSLKCDKDFWLAYCPERIAPGKILQEFSESARTVGGFDAKSTEIAVELLKTVTKGSILVADCATVELAKLAENAFRDVNIAFANELALISEKAGADVMEVIRLANTHPRVQIHKPGPGVGGPCLTKDPFLLLHPLEKISVDSKVILAARRLNDNMPEHIVELVIQGLRKIGKKVKGSKIGVLGVAYKGDTNDASNSPAERIISMLMGYGAKIVVYDPFCDESFGGEKVKDIAKVFMGSDCIVVATDHATFRKLELKKLKALMPQKPIIVDGKRVVDPEKAKEMGFFYYGVGYPS